MYTLQRGWNKDLNDLLQRVQNLLTISSPYISDAGANFLLDNVSRKFRDKGFLTFVTDLSPRNIYQGSTNPNSFKLLFRSINAIELFHLPRLHAKVYVGDESQAIVTSGNLTAGGIYNNFEYGVFLEDATIASAINGDLIGYGKLGAPINAAQIDEYCKISEELTKIYKQKEQSSKRELESRFRQILGTAKDELIIAKLRGESIHYVFERSILYLLQKHGRLPTASIHNLIEEIHPDLCDNSVDRVIDGHRFGKKWKHAARTAQQHLKKKGLARLVDGLWTLTE